jgi:hypothetical protein
VPKRFLRQKGEHKQKFFAMNAKKQDSRVFATRQRLA